MAVYWASLRPHCSSLYSSTAWTFFAAFVVGLIEEFTKILGILVIARRQRHDSELDGLILGAATAWALPRGRFRTNRKVIGAYFTVVILHGPWDGWPGFISVCVTSGLDIFIAQATVVGIIGLFVLRRRWHEARRLQVAQTLVGESAERERTPVQGDAALIRLP